jgi:3-oxosteroid 1-dehydrogenase
MAKETEIEASYDIVIIGSGAGGMAAALRAHDLGLSSVVLEKAHHYGGTSATSGGGIWIPLNDAIVADDSVEKALDYLIAATKGKVRTELLRTYVENAHVMTKYFEQLGVRFFAVPGYPDYHSELRGAVLSRAMLPYDIDGALLKDEFFRLRDHHPFLLAYNRYAMNFATSAKLSAKLPGWRWAGFKMLFDYWVDLRWRLKTRRDRRLTMGRALVGGLRKAMLDRDIPLFLNYRLVGLEKQSDRIAGAIFEHNGQNVLVWARKAVVLAAGGYEQNQAMRDAFMTVPTKVEASLTPAGGNVGDAIRIGRDAGAALENMENAWWCPSVRMPSLETPNTDISYQLFFERGRPGTISVNQLGKRFVDEAVSYDQFGQAMIADQKASGANNPCWMIFDARYRSKFAAGGLLPSWVTPDRSLPREWWDSIVYRGNSIEELARKISVDPSNLNRTVETMNRYAKIGVDEEFGRGNSTYDRFFGEMGIAPNPCLGPIDRPPFYAIRVELGDLGTKGGLRVDENAAVMGIDGRPILGLYAIGNTTGSLFGDCYPGAGATLGPAMTFGFVAANHIARSNSDASANNLRLVQA